MALTKAIEIKECLGPMSEKRYATLKAGAKIYRGSMVAFDSSGYLIEPTGATGLRVVGIATQTVDNTAGANGALGMEYKSGTFILYNGASTNAVTVADIGEPVYAMDGGTISRLAASKSPAGVLVGIDELGPMVKIGAAISVGITEPVAP